MNPSEKDALISPIAIDLGGMTTGLYLAHYPFGADPSTEVHTAAVIRLPQDGNGMTWSQRGRTQRRHLSRNKKRYRMARRLLDLMLQQGLGLVPDEAQYQRLHGYLKRRGYNRLQIEIDTRALSECPPDWFADVLPEFFDSLTPLDVQIENLLQDRSRINDLLATPWFSSPGKQAFKKRLEKYLPNEEKILITNAWVTLREILVAARRERDGNRHRREYLDNIRHDIARDELLRPLLKKHDLAPDILARIIGHISNLQLRPLRWYFNDESMKTGDYWDDARLQNCLHRWLQSIRPGTGEERTACRRALKALSEATDTIEFFRTCDPVDTIPPYEDQDNRRPPKDQTLWLAPAALDARWPQWQIAVAALRKRNPDWWPGDATLVYLVDRRSRPAWDKRAPALFLQRILDRSRAHDPYALRLLASKADSETANRARAELALHLGDQHLNPFLGLARDYYREIHLARQGLWRPGGLLERADLNPPHKRRILHLLTGNLFGDTDWDEAQLEIFKARIWTRPYHGRSTPRSVAARWFDIHRQWGNLLREKLRRLRYRHEQLGQSPRQWDKEERALWQAHERAVTAVDAIADGLGHGQSRRARYRNAWTLVQLHSLLEKDVHGFSRTSLAAHLENAWRMQMLPTEDGREVARCVRLSSDTTRPFDGVLRRILECQAREIAALKTRQILEHTKPGEEVFIPILVEENRFSFTLGIRELKKNSDSKLQKLFLARAQAQDQDWQDKYQRIRHATGNLCPYTGRTIGADGEIDHIVPRALSRDRAGTVFNHEANLIWCSRVGNRAKGKQRYTLDDLHDAWLQDRFSTHDRKAITQTIHQRVLALPDEFIFQDLDQDNQLAVRMALFLGDGDLARNKVLAVLAEQQKSRVNGTQAWLARRIIEELERRLTRAGIQARFDVHRIDARAVHDVRRYLAEHDARFAKPDSQPVSSHAIDALCVLAATAATPELGESLGLPETLAEDPEWLARFLPNTLEIHGIKSRPAYRKRNASAVALFNEGIYAERFLPVWIWQGTLHFGFDLEQNTLHLDEKHAPAWLERLLPFLMEMPGRHRPERDVASLLKENDAPRRFIVHRDRAFEHLYRVAKKEVDEYAREQADLLDGLCYFLQKQDLRSFCATQNGKWKPRKDLLKVQDFEVKIDCRIVDKRRLGGIKGKLALPVRDDWVRFLDFIESKNACKEGENLPEPHDWQNLCQAYFADTSNRDPDRRHQGVRRTWSLPRVVAPAGKLFRIRRPRGDGQGWVWQLQASRGSPSCGFVIRAGKVQWKETVLLPLLARSPDITPRGGRYTPEPEGIAWFDEWRELPAPEPLHRLSMAPGTENRAYLMLELSWEIFRAWARIEHDDPMLLPQLLKVDAKHFAQAHGIDLLGKPRNGRIELLMHGSVIRLHYTVESTSTALRQAWEKAQLDS